MVGIHNIRNATAVILLAQHNHLSAEQIQQGFSSFQGVKRRQELRGAINDIWVYDDFAHHPTAVAETIRALRQKHPGKRLCAVFEPRSNTSVLRIHQEQLVYALAQADEVLLAPPHRAERISPDERLDVKAIVHALNRQIPAHALEISAILEHLQATATSGDVILIMSNGKFDNLHERLLKILDSEIDLA